MIATTNKGVSTANLGVRIYFGVYNDADAITLANPYPNRMTMLFVPTIKTVTSGMIAEVDEVDSSSTGGIKVSAPPILNHGKLCPPDTCSGSKL